MGSNAYHARYMKARYHRRRSEWVGRLGDKCNNCGSDQDLQFDHIDRKTKSFDVGKALAGWSFDRLEKEMVKCQLLCRSCHVRKTNLNGDHGKGITKHGTYWMYRKYKCRCNPCVEANSLKLKEWKQKSRGCSSTGESPAS